MDEAVGGVVLGEVGELVEECGRVVFVLLVSDSRWVVSWEEGVRTCIF